MKTRLSWQSRERKAGKDSLPDTDAVRLTRIATGREPTGRARPFVIHWKSFDK